MYMKLLAGSAPQGNKYQLVPNTSPDNSIVILGKSVYNRHTCKRQCICQCSVVMFHMLGMLQLFDDPFQVSPTYIYIYIYVCGVLSSPYIHYAQYRSVRYTLLAFMIYSLQWYSLEHNNIIFTFALRRTRASSQNVGKISFYQVKLSRKRTQL